MNWLPTENESSIAVLIPCYNEAITIEQVVTDFRAALPNACIVVYDNNSTDGTAEIAARAGALVRKERRQGKGYVLQSMFREVEADIYIMVDGDGTYSPLEVQKLLEPVRSGDADMVIGSRLHERSRSKFRHSNRFGNIVFRMLLNSLFGAQLGDLLSGYRAFNRRCVRGMPLFEGGFCTETEMTIKALEQGFRVCEVPIDLSERPEGSHSKIRHVRDGFLILLAIATLWRDYRPLQFFSSLALMTYVAGLAAGIWAVEDFLRTGQMERLGAALLSVGLFLLGTVLGFAGLLLHTINRRFRELFSRLQTIADDARRGRV